MSFETFYFHVPEPEHDCCSYCGRPYTINVFFPDGCWMCEHCFWDYLNESDEAVEVAEALNIPYRSL